MTGVGRLKGRGAGGDAEADPVALISCREKNGTKGKNMHRIAMPAHIMRAFQNVGTCHKYRAKLAPILQAQNLPTRPEAIDTPTAPTAEDTPGASC